MTEAAQADELGAHRGDLDRLPFGNAAQIGVNGAAVRKDEVGLLPVGVVREIGAQIDRDRIDLDLAAEAHLVFEVFPQAAAPGMIGVGAVPFVLGNAVNGVSLEEAGVLARDEIGNRVRKIFGDAVPVVRIEREQARSVELGLVRNAAADAVVLSGEGLGRVAGAALVSEGDGELKSPVRQVDQRLGQRGIQADEEKLLPVRLDAEPVS